MKELLTSPIDQDANLNKLLDAFPIGKHFTLHQVGMLFNKAQHWVKPFMSQVRTALTHCPEGPQLEVTRGTNGHHKFVESKIDE